MSYSYEYPRAALTVDCVVVGVAEDALKVLLVRRGRPPFEGCWALPGGFVNLDETLEDAARRELHEETGVDLTHTAIEQLGAFDALDRDPRERTISIVHLAFVKVSDHPLRAGDDASDAAWFPLADLPELAFDHAHVLSVAGRQLEKAQQARLRA
jgi:8-oxo-dGTP diphosphatase